MQIIKDGNPQIRKINCPICSCVFIADICDYNLVENGLKIKVDCPYCARHLLLKSDYAPLCCE